MRITWAGNMQQGGYLYVWARQDRVSLFGSLECPLLEERRPQKCWSSMQKSDHGAPIRRVVHVNQPIRRDSTHAQVGLKLRPEAVHVGAIHCTKAE